MNDGLRRTRREIPPLPPSCSRCGAKLEIDTKQIIVTAYQQPLCADCAFDDWLPPQHTD